MPLNTPLANIKGWHQSQMLLYLMEWLTSERDHLSPHPSADLSWIPSPLRRGANQWFTTDGGIALAAREAYAMELCNAVLCGYGFRHLGEDQFETVTLRACAGQFQYMIDGCSVKGVHFPSVAVISPLLRHQHSGQPCHCKHVPFTGLSPHRKTVLYTALSNSEATSEAVVYVSMNCSLERFQFAT